MLSSVGYDPVYGAQPLKWVIQHEVQDSLALLRGEFSEGDTVRADFIAFEKVRTAPVVT